MTIKSSRNITLAGKRLSVPNDLMQHLENGMVFSVEMTDDGLLFRPVNGQPTNEPVELPEWAKPKAARSRKR